MADTTGMDAEILKLRERYNNLLIENSLRGGRVFDTEPVMAKIVARVRELGEAGVENMRFILDPKREFDTSTGVIAVNVLGKLEDTSSLKLFFPLIEQLWQTYEEFKGSIHPVSLMEVFDIIGNLIEPAKRAGHLDDQVIQYLLGAIERSDHYLLHAHIMGAAARTADERIKASILKIATYAIGDSLMNVIVNQSQPWEKPQAALFALRYFPDLQQTVLALINHPNRKMANTAAETLIAMLNLIPGEGGADYTAWKAWVLTRLPQELVPPQPGGLKRLFQSKPILTRQQQIFWDTCITEHGVYHRDHPAKRG